MDIFVKRIYQMLIIFGLSALLLILAFANPLFINSSDFSIYNPSWNGCSNIAIKSYKTGKLQPTFYFEDNELTLSQYSFSDYNLIANNSCILIIGPRTSFSTFEINYIKKFLSDGGMLLLADDFGTGNEILKGINASSRFSGDLLLDLSFEKSARFVTVFDFENRSNQLFSNVSRILLNYPTTISTGRNTTVFAYSSELSWIDKNLNGKEDSGEATGPFPVFAIETFGKGSIVLLSDPSVLINSIKDELDNNIFIKNLLSFLYTNRNTIIIDESHRDISSTWQISYLLPRTIGFEFKIAIVLLVVFVFITGFTTIPKYLLKKFNDLISKRPEEKKVLTDKEIIEKVLKKHPNWNRNKLENILRGFE